jgi:DNA-binding NarL/FixJ family response regulator
MNTAQLTSKPTPQLEGRVLIVEDNEILGQVIFEYLSKLGVECVWARTFEEASQELSKRGFHAVIVDVFLNSDDPQGLELVRSLEPRGIPVVLMSGRADLRIAKEAMNCGARHLLEKPFQIEELKPILQKIWTEPSGMTGMIERYLDTHGLTEKEKEIARCILKGLSNREIAEINSNTEKTVKAHVTAIFQKCTVKTRTELINDIIGI